MIAQTRHTERYMRFSVYLPFFCAVLFGSMALVLTRVPAPMLQAELISPSTQSTVIRRGSIIETTEGQRELLRIGDRYVTLDERTNIELDSLDPNEVVITLHKGRLLLASDIEAKTRIQTPHHSEAQFLRGAASFVTYDFLETFSVLPFGTSVGIIPSEGEGFLTSTPVNIHETPPVTIEDISFTITGSAAEPFYVWSDASLAPFLNARAQPLIQ